MQHWLISNRAAGTGARGAGFWQEHLASAGVESVNIRDFHDTAWINEVSEGDCILAAGGDGSVNRAASICIDRGAVLAVLPSGTANDFARNLGLPTDPAELCQLVARHQWQWADVARHDGGLFLNVAHVGLGTHPVRESRKHHKARWGRFSYALTLLRRINAGRGFRATVTADTGELEGRWLTLAVATGAYFGGGQPIPKARADDGWLDIIAVRPRSPLILLFTYLVMRLRGRSPRRTSTVVHLKAHQCRIQTRKPKTVTADGEIVAKTPIDIRCEPGCLAVICETIVET